MVPTVSYHNRSSCLAIVTALVLLLGWVAIPSFAGPYDLGTLPAGKQDPSTHKQKASRSTHTKSSKREKNKTGSHTTDRHLKGHSTTRSERGGIGKLHVIPGSGPSPVSGGVTGSNQPGAGRSAPGNPLQSGASAGSVPPGSLPDTIPSSANSGMISMDFRGADINNVLKFFALATNWQIVPDPSLSGPVTIISPMPLTIDQAFQVLQAVLEIRGFAGQLTGNILRIVPLDRAVQSTVLLNSAELKNLGNQVITQVVPVQTVDATKLAQELQPLMNKGASLIGSAGTNALVITDTADNVRRVMDIVKMLDMQASNNEIKVFPLQRATATDVADTINNIFSSIYQRATAQAAPGKGGKGRPQMMMAPPGMPGQPGAAAAQESQRAAVIAVPDLRTNSVVLVASKDDMKKVSDLITKLDAKTPSEIQNTLIKLKYADATDVASTINMVLSNNMPTAGTQSRGTPFQRRVFGGFFGAQQQQQQTVNSTNPFAKVAADERTNSLIVSATPDQLDRIKALVKELDVNVPVETTTFVIPLNNAQAQNVAYTLNQAFSNTAGQSLFSNSTVYNFGGYQQTGAFQHTPIKRTLGNSAGRSAIQPVPGVQSRAETPGDPTSSDPSAVPGVMTPDGFIPDKTTQSSGSSDQSNKPPASRQFFRPFMGGFGMQQNQPQYGRSETGQYVNLLQLQGNVVVVPDTNTNSLIITTQPSNIKAIRQIVQALDVVPKQVMMQVVIAEVTLNKQSQYGFEFQHLFSGKTMEQLNLNFPINSTGNITQNLANPPNPGVQYGILRGTNQALLQALASNQNVRILSTPSVFTSNNQPADIDITTNIPYITNTFISGFSASQSLSYSFLPVGLQLSVTPQITSDNFVTVDVVAEASDLLQFVPLSNGTNQVLAPETADRYADTEVTVKDGDTVVIGGLIQDNKSTSNTKVPILGDIPIIGNLFRFHSVNNSRSELMIFVTPHVVTNEAQAKSLTQSESQTIIKAMPSMIYSQLHIPPPSNESPKSPKDEKK